MSEPSIIAALKMGFRDSKTYYDALRSYGATRGSFFDKYLCGHIVVGYQDCQDIYRNSKDFGRSRLAFPDDFFAGTEGRRAAEGYRTFKSMSIFQNTGEVYADRRQRLLAVLGTAKRAMAGGMVRSIACDHIGQIPKDEDVDIFSTSLRRYAAQCANVALIGKAQAPDLVQADALAAANFLDGKRVSKPHVVDALDAIDRLAEWISGEHGVSRECEYELVADLVLLYVAAHESLAYLLYTCLVQLANTSEEDCSRKPDGLASLITEATRIDSPVQMGGRVALVDVRIGGSEFRAGEKVYLHLGAANRDGGVFERPDSFIENRPTPHLAFGWGPTRCVGSEYATACALEYLTALLAQFKRIGHAAERSVFDHGLSARGLKSAFFTFE